MSLCTEHLTVPSDQEIKAVTVARMDIPMTLKEGQFKVNTKTVNSVTTSINYTDNYFLLINYLLLIRTALYGACAL